MPAGGTGHRVAGGHRLATLQTEPRASRHRCAAAGADLAVGGVDSAVHRAAHHAAYRAAYARHGAKAHTQVGELADGLVSGDLRSHVKASLLLIGIPLLRPLGGHGLRGDDGFLRLGLGVDDVRLLAQLRLGDVGILPEIQFLEGLVLPLTLGSHHIGDKKPLQRHAVVGEVLPQQPVQRVGELRQMLIDLENADSAGAHGLGDVALDPRGQKHPEETGELRLSQLPLSAHQFDEQLAAVGRPQAHFAAGTDGQGKAVSGLHVLHLTVGIPLDPHLLRLVDEIDLAVEGIPPAGSALQRATDLRQVFRLQRVAPRAEQIQRLAVQEKHSLLRLVDDKLSQTVEILTGMLPDEGRIVALILNDVCNMPHNKPPHRDCGAQYTIV